MKKLIPLFAAMLMTANLAFGQDVQLSPTVIASAGNYSESGDISLSWTLGEIAVSTLSGGDIVLTQGFQQAYLVGTGFDLDPISWQIIAYPNPVSSELKIQFDVLEVSNFLIEIQDVTGRILSLEQYKEVFPGDVIQVEMNSYKSGVYFFRVSSTDRKQVRVLSIRKD